MTANGAVDAVVAALSTVDAIGSVHRYRRSLRTAQDITAALYDATQKRLSGAFVSISAIRPTSQELNRQMGAVGAVVQFDVRIELFRSCEDAKASEVDFRALVENVLRKTKATKLYAASSSQTAADATINMMMLAETVLVHYSEVTLQIGGRAAY